MFNEIEDFRFQYRFQTRNDATVTLIRMGLEKVKEENREQIGQKVKDMQTLRKSKPIIVDANAAAYGGGLLNVPSPPVDEHHKKIAEELEFEDD